MSGFARVFGLTVTYLAASAFAQSTAPRASFDEFEVASIKPAPADAAGRWLRMTSANELTAHNHGIVTLIAAAYNVSPKAISGGPAWVNSERYDIVARTPGAVRPNLNEQMAMLRRLLTDPYHLRFHREPREMRAYALTIAKGGAKLQESQSTDASPQGPPPLIFVVSPQVVRLPGRSATMGELASVLQRAALDDPVVDKTGLTARYDFDLEFTPDESVFGGELGKGGDDAAKPGLFGAIQQQLGLRLETGRSVVEVLVIDHVEHPSEN